MIAESTPGSDLASEQQSRHTESSAQDDPSHGITLVQHAQIAARIAEGDVPLAKVLEAHALNEDQWNEATMHWMMRLGEDVAKHGATAALPHDYSDAFARAQDAIRPVPAMTPEDWAILTVEIQNTGGPARPLAIRNFSTADYLRLARHWAKVLSSDPIQGKRFFVAYEALQPKQP